MTDQELQTDLLRRMSLDQEARQRVEGYSEDARLAEWAAVREVDNDNTAWLYAVVAERGWPRICEVAKRPPLRHGCWPSTPTTTPTYSCSSISR